MEKENKDFFYQIFVEGKNPPKMKFYDFSEAEQEAERLCRKEKTKTYILSVGAVIEPVISIKKTYIINS